MTFLFILGLVALILGVLSYALVFYVNTARAEKVAEKVNALFEDLDSDSIVSRVTSIDGFVTLAGLVPSVDLTICDGISSFVREHAKADRRRISGHPEPDIQAGVRSLSKLVGGHYCDSVDLSGSDLRGLDLVRGTLPRANLSRALLDEANLSGTDLTGAHLIGSSLVETTLRGARLENALLSDARIQRTDLRGADLSGAQGLAGADLMTAVMSRAILTKVDLRAAKLSVETTMNGVSLTNADLRQTDLRFVKGLCKRDIDSALIDQNTKLPMEYAC
jgi:hypothetical protein